MRAVVVPAPGGPEVLAVSDAPAPEPGPGQLLVDVEVAGVNYIDTYQRSGLYPIPTPFVLGLEGCGTVAATGPDVPGVAPGDRVAWASARGSYAEQVVLDAEQAVPVPEGLDPVLAGGSLLQGMTAHYLCSSTVPVAEGDWVVVHAAAGGVGLLLTQLVKQRGGRVLATTSTPEKAALAGDAGADEVATYEEFVAAARRLTGGAGVAAVFDGVGRATFDAGLEALRRRGTMVLYGAASGPVPPLDLQRLNAAGSLFTTRPKLGDYTASREELLWRAGDVLAGLTSQALRLTIGGTYALADARRAHEDLESRRTTGKLVLTVH